MLKSCVFLFFELCCVAAIFDSSAFLLHCSIHSRLSPTLWMSTFCDSSGWYCFSNGRKFAVDCRNCGFRSEVGVVTKDKVCAPCLRAFRGSHYCKCKESQRLLAEETVARDQNEDYVKFQENLRGSAQFDAGAGASSSQPPQDLRADPALATLEQVLDRLSQIENRMQQLETQLARINGWSW